MPSLQLSQNIKLENLMSLLYFQFNRPSVSKLAKQSSIRTYIHGMSDTGPRLQWSLVERKMVYTVLKEIPL